MPRTAHRIRHRRGRHAGIVQSVLWRERHQVAARGQIGPEVVNALTAADDGREHRQLHVMDAAGRVAAHTGKECVDWCGSTAGEGFSVAGNMLAGPAVIAETAQAYATNPAL